MSKNQPFPPLNELLRLNSFRDRTPMYIGEKSITSLKSFIDGVLYAMDAYEMIDPKIPDFGDFNEWVASYFERSESTAGWRNIILEECLGDEEVALSRFFELYDLFISKY